MFTGLVQRTGRLTRRTRPGGGTAVAVAVGRPWESPLRRGESVAVQGVCLTVRDFLPSGVFVADVLDETLACTTLGTLPDGALVNLERALRADDRLGGHIVQGHVDALGHLADIRDRGSDLVFRVQTGPDTLRTLVYKGSVAIDGTSLTVSALSDDGGWFEVNLIPTTLRDTSLAERRVDDAVNLETDVVGKYVERLLRPHRAAGAGNSDGARDEWLAGLMAGW